MKLLLSLSFLLLLSHIGIAQSELRTVEVTGKAQRKFLADFVSTTINILPGEQCAIPTGKNYQKYIKECKENNKQLVASRENIFKGILDSYNGRIKLGDKDETEYTGSMSYTITSTNYADLADLVEKLKDFKGAFTSGVIYGEYSKMTEAIADEVQLESLLDARKKAEAMAKTLGASVDKVMNIYEEKPSSSGMSDFYSQIMAMEAAKEVRRNGFNTSPGFSPYPDSEGYLYYSATSYVRFSIK